MDRTEKGKIKVETMTTVTAGQLRAMLEEKFNVKVPAAAKITVRETKGEQRIEIRWPAQEAM